MRTLTTLFWFATVLFAEPIEYVAPTLKPSASLEVSSRAAAIAEEETIAQKPQSAAIEAAREVEEAPKKGEKFYEADDESAGSQYTRYLKKVERYERDYYRQVQAAKSRFYKKMQDN
jgi:hypothetical protein